MALLKKWSYQKLVDWHYQSSTSTTMADASLITLGLPDHLAGTPTFQWDTRVDLARLCFFSTADQLQHRNKPNLTNSTRLVLGPSYDDNMPYKTTYYSAETIFFFFNC